MPARPQTGTPHALTGSVLRRSVQVMTRGITAEPRVYALAIGPLVQPLLPRLTVSPVAPPTPPAAAPAPPG